MLDRFGPDLDESLQGPIGDEFLGREDLHGSRTRVVTIIEPALDAGSVVCYAGAQAHRRFHDVERYRAPEQARNSDVQIVPYHLLLFLLLPLWIYKLSFSCACLDGEKVREKIRERKKKQGDEEDKRVVGLKKRKRTQIKKSQRYADVIFYFSSDFFFLVK